MSVIKQLFERGQSIWLDFIRRSYVESGELRANVAQGVRGVTSNPAIFDKAIAGSSDYDDQMRELVREGLSVPEIYEALAVRDIQMAADDLIPLYRESDGRDGFVSLEVSPLLALDTEGTIAEARRLHDTVARPNVMIKVPATAEGIPAIEELIAAGVNVNVTLIFAIARYREVMEAYLKGLERLVDAGPTVREGHHVDRVASVASFFVSRVDSKVDDRLDAAGKPDLKGTIAIANAKMAYQAYLEVFQGPRWEALAAKGARVQRPLWASTSTKNPDFPDTLYVDQLIGPDTVNTVPPETLTAFLDHGAIADTLTADVDVARTQLAELAAAGIDLDTVTEELLQEGVAKFADPFNSLLDSIAAKRDAFIKADRPASIALGDLQRNLNNGLLLLKDRRTIERIWSKDHTVWSENPDEIANRLGWLDSPRVMREAVDEIDAVVDAVRKGGFRQALLLGMGGSSMAPEVFRHIFGVEAGYLDLAVLDSTDPGAVLAHGHAIDPEHTLFVVSTKSGGTVETLSFMKYFFREMVERVGADKAGSHFIAITDPGSGLEEMAVELGFRHIFRNDPDIGGRYSALSCFGLVPAALVGVDIARLIDNAEDMARAIGTDQAVEANSAARFGVAMGELAELGRDKLTLVLSPPLAPFGAWAEQLIAESLGKAGKGVLPVDGEPVGAPGDYGNDRLFVYLQLAGDDTHDAAVDRLHEAGHPVIRLVLADRYDLGGELLRWELATAVAGAVMGINPFDQPNVESAKVRAREMMSAYRESGKLPQPEPTMVQDGIELYGESRGTNPAAVLRQFLDGIRPGENEMAGRSYVAIQAYVQPDEAADKALRALQAAIMKRRKVATTLGYGPRFLHSTGQLHKGDAGNGLFLQITSSAREDAAIPDDPTGDESAMTFGTLKTAQALGDRQALLDEGRQVLRLHFNGGDWTTHLAALTESL